MNCPRCGTPNPEGGDTCVNCGNDLGSTTTSTPPYTQPVVQQQYPQFGTAPAAIPNYLAQSILVTLCCCLPTGIPAIVFAAQVNSKLLAGDIQGAMRASNNAKTWCWVSFGLGLALTVVQLILIGLGMGGAFISAGS